MFLLGYVLQRGLLNFTLGTDILPPLLVTFGLSIIIQNALLQTFSADPRALRLGGFETGSFHLGADIAVGYFPLLVLGVAVVLTAGLELMFGRSPLGRAFRATSDDPEAVKLMGVNDRHVYALAMGSALAIVAVAAVFYGIRTTFGPTDGPDRLLFAFEAVIIGGLGSFWGTLAGGYRAGSGAGHRLPHGPRLGRAHRASGFPRGAVVQAHRIVSAHQMTRATGEHVEIDEMKLPVVNRGAREPR